ncbi:CHASE domain-containing protein [Porphyrobacter sp. GA68]|uniref:CHASE domain-containing protein n=1 Tax=Porphyrobacter sp. GA68 TaxID=2883480 RepID=UPI001D19247A|nr:CHASE domain-containing protein [Porphyrobacter sp. GA68]
MSRSWLDRHPRAAPLLIFFLIAAITVVSVMAIERGENAREQVRLYRQAEGLTAALSRRAATTAAYLRAGSALFETRGTVTPETFRRFSAELKLDQNFRGAEGIGWAPALRPEQVPDFERRAVEESRRVITVTPQPSVGIDLVVPIYYLQPDTPENRRAIGFDMYSQPVRREAINAALRTRQPTASGPVVLRQEESGSAPGFLIYMPVFANEPGQPLKGFIYSPFRSEEFLRAAFAGEASANQHRVELIDLGTATATLVAAIGPDARNARTASARMMIAGRPFEVRVFSAGQPMLSPLSLATLLFGMAVAVLLMVMARLLAAQVREDRQRLAWFEEQNSIRDSLTRELNHRVKNTLANVLSIIALTRRRASDLDEFADSLDGRIRALSATHDLLTRSDWGTTPIHDVIAAEVAPYARGENRVVESAGPDVELAPNDALSLGLAIHELATNAAKYGALSQAGGKVKIDWELAADNLARVKWVETGGPPVPESRSRGFGTDLLQKIIAHELRHPVELDFAPTGVRCTLVIPVREPRPFAIRAGGQNKAQTSASEPAAA